MLLWAPIALPAASVCLLLEDCDPESSEPTSWTRGAAFAFIAFFIWPEAPAEDTGDDMGCEDEGCELEGTLRAKKSVIGFPGFAGGFLETLGMVAGGKTRMEMDVESKDKDALIFILHITWAHTPGYSIFM